MDRTDRIKEIYDRNWDSLYRLCLVYMRNQEDACDMVQETFVRFLRYIEKQTEAGRTLIPKASAEISLFQDIDYERAWLRTVACNLCKDELRHWWRRKRTPMDSMEDILIRTEEFPEQETVIEALWDLPEKYRVLLYLHYYEGYSLGEIGEILQENPSTLRSRISKGRKLLGEKLKENGYGEKN